MRRKRISKRVIYILTIIGFISLVSVGVVLYATEKYCGDSKWIFIDKDYSEDQLRDSLQMKLGCSFGNKVFILWGLKGSAIKSGAYKFKQGETAWDISRAIAENDQTPVMLTFNNIRTMEQLAKRVAKKFMFDNHAFLTACDSVLTRNGFKKEEYPVIFFPDSYEFYWTSSPTVVVEKLLGYYNKYWNEDNLKKAAELGLSSKEVSILASIVEEETNKADERPMVARLYLNRLKKGMKLQADPTIKFAIGDFSLRRIMHNHLTVESPYNTYQNVGLPPGPIRIVEKKTLDAVLNAPQHEYLYMCAKEDFSGYHNFAVDYSTHQANARRYQQELNRRKIK